MVLSFLDIFHSNMVDFFSYLCQSPVFVLCCFCILVLLMSSFLLILLGGVFK